MTLTEQIITIGMVVLGTIITRFLPFLLFPAGKPVPRYVQYLGKALPSAVFGLLVIYCLKNVDLMQGSHGIPELLSLAAVAALPFVETADASLDCRRHSFLYGAGSADILMSAGWQTAMQIYRLLWSSSSTTDKSCTSIWPGAEAFPADPKVMADPNTSPQRQADHSGAGHGHGDNGAVQKGGGRFCGFQKNQDVFPALRHHCDFRQVCADFSHSAEAVD